MLSQPARCECQIKRRWEVNNAWLYVFSFSHFRLRLVFIYVFFFQFFFPSGRAIYIHPLGKVSQLTGKKK